MNTFKNLKAGNTYTLVINGKIVEKCEITGINEKSVYITAPYCDIPGIEGTIDMKLPLIDYRDFSNAINSEDYKNIWCTIDTFIGKNLNTSHLVNNSYKSNDKLKIDKDNIINRKEKYNINRRVPRPEVTPLKTFVNYLKTIKNIPDFIPDYIMKMGSDSVVNSDLFKDKPVYLSFSGIIKKVILTDWDSKKQSLTFRNSFNDKENYYVPKTSITDGTVKFLSEDDVDNLKSAEDIISEIFGGLSKNIESFVSKDKCTNCNTCNGSCHHEKMNKNNDTKKDDENYVDMFDIFKTMLEYGRYAED